MPLSPLRVGSARFRIGRWHGDPQVAVVVVLSDARSLHARNLACLRGRLVRMGFFEAYTSAVGPALRDALVGGGFEVHERLDLFSHDLSALWPAPARASGLRRGRRRDRSGVLQVDQETFEPFWQLDHDGLRESMLATPSTRHRVIRRDGGVVAYSVAGMGGRSGFLQRLAVAPTHQRSGLGSALVTDSLHWARRCGAESMWVNTQESNRTAVGFYLRLGFVPADYQLTVLHRRL